MGGFHRCYMSAEQESLKQLFQQQYAKMVAVISRAFGLQHIEIAEDIISETFLLASENWAIKGMPENPPAWLYMVARRKMLAHMRRDKIFTGKVIPGFSAGHEKFDEIAAASFSPENIKDSQLQMLFAICNAAIGSEAQIGLALRILCGFGIEEIAEAFFSNKETINKRLFRAKEKLRAQKLQLELPEQEISKRLDNVLHILYLLFNEGYYSKTRSQILRKDLCLEAMRLALILTGYATTDLPKTNALIALMCFHASRFGARQHEENALVLYEQQNEELWDEELINQGCYFLERSVAGNELSAYHLEARIAYAHCTKEDTPGKWEEILALYNRLLLVNYSPSAALNRTYALYQVNGWQPALAEAEKLKLNNNHFYWVLLGELYKHTDKEKARLNFLKAHDLAKTQTEKEGIQKLLDKL